MFAGLRKNPARDQRVADAMQLLGLSDLMERMPSELSGGQQQRVALGRAIVRQPAVFLLDEPLSNLDSRLRLEMRRELHLLHKRFPATMFYVTHDPVEALALADRVAVLDNGTLQQVDRPQTVYDRPHNRRVAGFFGSPPMNLLDGLLVEADGGRAFRSAEGTVTFPLSVEVAGTGKVGQMVTLGVRPEDLALRTDPAALTMTVVLIEPTGANCLLTLQHEEVRLTALTERQTGMDGPSVKVVWNMERTHLFDGATGQALGHGSRTG
jgi:multiple sugar transport system ATP-binding protein